MRICGEMRSRRASTSYPVEELPAAPSAGPAGRVESDESRGTIRKAVASLPEHYRVPVALRFFDGMTCEEIASRLGEPVGTIWTRLHRANAILRRALGFLEPAKSGGGR